MTNFYELFVPTSCKELVHKNLCHGGQQANFFLNNDDEPLAGQGDGTVVSSRYGGSAAPVLDSKINEIVINYLPIIEISNKSSAYPNNSL